MKSFTNRAIITVPRHIIEIVARLTRRMILIMTAIVDAAKSRAIAPIS